MTLECPHEQTEFGKVLMRDGRFHILERCIRCRANVRGTGWCPHSEVDDPESLPVFRDNHGITESGLFD